MAILAGCFFTWTARNWLAMRVLICLPYPDNTSGLKPWGSPADEATKLFLVRSCNSRFDHLLRFASVCGLLRPFCGFLRPICGNFGAQFCAKTANGQTKGQFLLPIPVPVLAPLLNGTKFRICNKARRCLEPQAQLPRKCFTGRKRTVFTKGVRFSENCSIVTTTSFEGRFQKK